MKGLLEDLRVRELSGDALKAFGDPDWLLANVNTADEYAALMRQIARTHTD
jgi:hypothetical protein